MTPEELQAAGQQLQANLTANNAVVVPAGIKPKQIMDANTKLVNQTNDVAKRTGNELELRQQMLAPGLAGGSNAPGGYMYQRNMAPVVGALTTGLTSQARQNVLRGAIRDNLYTVERRYEDAQRAYRKRQRDYQKEQAARNRKRRQEAEARERAYYSRGSGYGGGGGYTYTTGGGGNTGVYGTVGGNPTANGPTMTQRKGGGYNFTDGKGNAISAATFAHLTGTPFNQLLGTMSKSGDKGAQRVLTRSDNSAEYAKLYRALTWQ